MAQMFMEAMQDNECIVIRVRFNQLTFNQESSAAIVFGP